MTSVALIILYCESIFLMRSEMRILAPFHYGLFWHAMLSLLGREPDSHHAHGDDGLYMFRYEPKNKAEEKKFAESVGPLQEWLSLFELIPLRSRCEYGRLLHPHKGEENKNYLDIVIAHPVEKEEKKS